MGLHIPDKWVWDFWFAEDGPDYHMFYLQAPRALEDERLRHWHVSIGHAVSQDLRTWQILPDALAPTAGDPTAWDSYTTWTGSIIRHEGVWHLFYTGSSRAEKGLIQRIGLATSKDLITWHKHPANPLIEADSRWYELLDQDSWHDQAWRDPWLFRLPGDDRFHCYITGRANHGHPSARGVVAYATSPDLLKWEVKPPVSEIGEFGYLEVPQLVEIDGRWYLFFCVGHQQFSQDRLQRPAVSPVTGTHYLVGDSPLGPFRLLTDEFLLADPAGSLYAGKVVRDPAGGWALMTSRSWTGDGGFIGEIADPLPLQVLPDGLLRVDRPEQP